MKQRTFPKPTAIESAHLGDKPTLDELELVALYASSPSTLWAERVLSGEMKRSVTSVLNDETDVLPHAILAAGTGNLIIGLTRDDMVLKDGEWVEDDELFGATVPLSLDEIAFVARAFSEGFESVQLRSELPVAWLTSDSALTAAGESDVPEGATVIAVVDELDKNAVLELLAITKGPEIQRRHNGKWESDNGWLIDLKSLDPPPIVKLDSEMVGSVIAQVDEATKDEEFEKKVTKQKKIQSSATIRGMEARLDQIEIDALLAVAKSPKGIKSTEKLKQYWTTGKGGLTKIRWGTPGSWTRCHRHLVKYIGPRAKGYCMNLCQRMGGSSVGCHVGTKAKRKAKSALRGAAKYEKSDWTLKSKSKSESKSTPNRSSTPHARKDRKTDRVLSTAEIEQRREAARKSALARRKNDSASRAEEWKTMTLAEKVEMAAQIEEAARIRKQELESKIRATKDAGDKAALRGELDDINDMLSAKDSWVRNAKADELRVINDALDEVRREADSLKEASDRKIKSKRREAESLEVQIQFAETEVEKIELRGQAAVIRGEVKQLSAERDAIGEASAKAIEELTDRRSELMDAYREATEYLKRRRKTESEFMI